jgi:site-specific recombinase XerD
MTLEANEMEQAIKRFEQYIKSRYPDSTTARHYVHDLQQFDRLIGKSPQAVTREDVDRFVEDQLERGLAATTINRRLAALHEFFEHLAAESAEVEWPNPVNWKRHKVKPGKPLPRDVSETEIERLFAHITHARDKAMFRLMLDVGLRVEEVAQLRVNDLMVDSNDAMKRLRVQGKGNKERFVWLAPETVQIVQTWLEQRPAVASRAMFITRRNRGFSVRGIQERLAHYCQLAKVEVSPRQLRHTFGRRMAEANMPVTSLAALMGHDQVSTTQIYIAGAGKQVQTDYQAAIARLEAARLESLPTWDSQPERDVDGVESVDVWALAGVEPQSGPALPLRPEDKTDLSRYWEGLPYWLTSLLQEYILYRQHRWKPSQVRNLTRVQLRTLHRVWRWLLDHAQIDSVADLKQAHVQRFIEARLTANLKSESVNAELTALWAFISYLEERDYPVSPSVFRVKRPKRGDPVPRFLNELDYQSLESQVLHATQAGERDDRLDRAWFYLLSEAGLRISEVCDLRLGNVDLVGQRLVVRHGKHNRDRTLPLSPNLLTALKAYLPVRGEAQTDHLLIYRQQAVNSSLIDGRLRRYGQQAHVQVSPHRLRHTLATRLLNEGMPITSIQRLLGHKTLSSTLVYARVHNETVQRDYEHAYAHLTPTSPLADDLFGAPTKVPEPQPSTMEDDCV